MLSKITSNMRSIKILGIYMSSSVFIITWQLDMRRLWKSFIFNYIKILSFNFVVTMKLFHKINKIVALSFEVLTFSLYPWHSWIFILFSCSFCANCYAEDLTVFLYISSHRNIEIKCSSLAKEKIKKLLQLERSY